MTVEGLTEKDGSPAWMNNADFIYDKKRNKYWMIRERHPYPPERPNYISAECQISVIGGEDLRNDVNAWEVMINIGSVQTGKPRNHNACLISDEFGYLPEQKVLDFCVSVSNLGDSSLWTYRIWGGRLIIK